MKKSTFQNTLYTNDNLFILYGMNSESVDLIYLDPPMNSKRMFSQKTKATSSNFKEIWTWQDVNEHYLDTIAAKFPKLAKYITAVGEIHGKSMMAYLTYMAQRLVEMHRVLKPTGSLYLHCEPATSHYLKVLLDEIFGKNNFQTEVIWAYAWGVRMTTRWNRKHHTILMYTKSQEYTFNYQDVLEERRTSEATKTRLQYKGAMTTDRNKGRGAEEMALPTDVWYVPTINAMSKERTGYPTQKPLALLQRIILASSNEGDVVFDPFCGCSTTCVAAQQLKRKWIGIDIEKQAVKILKQRLSAEAEHCEDFVVTDKIPNRTDIREIGPSPYIKKRLYQDQAECCHACGEHFELQDLDIYHIIPKSQGGGGDYYENYQLLCKSCNRIKSNHLMEYLRLKLERSQNQTQQTLVFGE